MHMSSEIPGWGGDFENSFLKVSKFPSLRGKIENELRTFSLLPGGKITNAGVTKNIQLTIISLQIK